MCPSVSLHRKSGALIVYGAASLACLALLICSPSGGLAEEAAWPGLPPDCWTGTRFVHGPRSSDPWKSNTRVTQITGTKPEGGTLSPNQGYRFIVEEGSPTSRLVIDAEKDHLLQLTFSDSRGLTQAHWVNEKLIFLRAWWGRRSATDLIFDVEKEQFLYSETVTDGTLALQQFKDSCPLLGCTCIKKP